MDAISALMDGELDDAQKNAQLERLRGDADSRERWDLFHVIGDALRGERMLSHDFARRIAERLATEPTVLAPRRSVVRKAATYALSLAASLSAVAMVAWVALAPTGLTSSRDLAGPVAAVVGQPAPATPIAPPASPVMVVSVPSGGTMNDYILAHQGFSPSTAIQGVAPYIRGVSAGQSSTQR